MNSPLRFIDTRLDPWHAAVGEDGPMAHPKPEAGLLLTLEQWHAVRDTWPTVPRTGVSVPNDVDIETLEADLPRLALVALQFPKWIDGRAYSQARLLRARFRFRGEVRATGEVLVDMLPLLARTGFDAVVLRADQNREAAERALKLVPSHYQGDVSVRQPLFGRSGGAAAWNAPMQKAGA
jgi:uncharacterized protein (DUF934 family)